MNAAIFFDIIIVSFQAGDKLCDTVESVLTQQGVAGNVGVDFKVIVKDGNSTDGSVEHLVQFLNTCPQHLTSRVQILRGADEGIYDAMNIALDACYGSAGHTTLFRDDAKHLTYFLNCGDYLANREVLRTVADKALNYYKREKTEAPVIFYGDVYEDLTAERVTSNPVIDAFACYRHVPNHQACFYDAALFMTQRFDTSLKVRADYDHFLYSYFRGGAQCEYLQLLIAHYEGGGFSESERGRMLSGREHRIVLRRYFSDEEIARFDRRMKLTLQPLRTALASNRRTAGIYNTLKRTVYRLRGRRK